MVSFLICLALLIGGYFVYGKVVENTFGPDDRETPAVKINDGVDYVVLPQWKLFMIQLLNIAGLGPIFGAMQGALWGPIVFLWITFGTIFAGAVHDYFSGMMSERNNGASISEISGIYLGGFMKNVMRVFSVVLLIMVGTVFAVGPAGSGKTYTAIALAVRALKEKHVKRIILTRPAVEAGEKLGFLPGDMKDKIDPYLQPLYDALQDMIPAAKLKEYMELNVIQIAPLAFMRGRTLNDAVVILDEAQNTTTQQIKMFLTRMGMNTKMIVTGDMTQIDLPASQTSGLVQAIKILKGVKGISFIELNKKDIVRHKLVTRIVEAYEKFEEKEKAERKTTRTAKEPEKTPQA